jgi:hypothetical protein
LIRELKLTIFFRECNLLSRWRLIDVGRKKQPGLIHTVDSVAAWHRAGTN